MKSIFEERALIYDCEVERFENDGITLLEVESMRGKNYITAASYMEHLFLRIDPEMENPLEQIHILKEWSTTEIIHALQGYYSKSNRSLDKTYCYYYYLEDKPLVNQSSLKIERIRNQNTDQLMTFLNNLTDEELDLADIDLDKPDPVIFGGFVDNEMVAYISHRYPNGSQTIADIGIVVNTNHRRNGYGKALLVHEVNWCIKNDIIPMYVVLEENIKSVSLVESLAFVKLGDIYRLK